MGGRGLTIVIDHGVEFAVIVTGAEANGQRKKRQGEGADAGRYK